MSDDTRPDQQLDGCLTHLELLLLLMTNNIIKRMDEKLQNQICETNESDDEEDLLRQQVFVLVNQLSLCLFLVINFFGVMLLQRIVLVLFHYPENM
jgi:hypothetical protein